jgi:polar amino acid transport system permease protein
LTSIAQPHDPSAPSTDLRAAPILDQLGRFPWWLLVVVVFIGFYGITISLDADYREAFRYVARGLTVTIVISILSYFISLVLGLIAGLMRVSNNIILNNLATLYVELVRGIPMLVLIFFIAFVVVPGVITQIQAAGLAVESAGLPNPLANLQNRDVPMAARAVIALALTYGAFLAEIFRAGIQSIGKGQMEAARSLGMSYAQAMRYIILPQAVRNVLPALGNDFVAMVKDSSLVSVLAVGDITHLARQHASSSFRYMQSFGTLVILYLTMTFILSLLIRLVERRLNAHG